MGRLELKPTNCRARNTGATLGVSPAHPARLPPQATPASTGGGLGHENMPPFMLFTYYIKL